MQFLYIAGSLGHDYSSFFCFILEVSLICFFSKMAIYEQGPYSESFIYSFLWLNLVFVFLGVLLLPRVGRPCHSFLARGCGGCALTLAWIM